MPPMNPLGAAILAYVGLQILVGFWVSSRIQNDTDYLLGGRSLGLGLATMSLFATWFGAETCVGAAGAVYEGGLAAASADPFGYGLCLLLAGLLLAIPLRSRGYVTLGDLFRERFGAGVERLAVVVMIPGSVLWAAAQIRAFGHVLAASGDVAPTVGIVTATVVVAIYTSSGGLLADAYTDILQGAVLITGLVALGVAVVWSGDAAAIEASQLAPVDPELPWIATAESWAVPVVGSLVAQELASRMLAARDPETARRAAFLAAPLYVAVGLVPVMVGLAATHALPGLEDPEQALALQAQRHLHPVFYVVFAGALVSAILSTVDSALLAAGGLVSHNLVLRAFPDASERTRLWASKGSVLAFGAVAAGFALGEIGVHELVELASGIGSAGLVVLVAASLGVRHGGPRAATATLIVGLLAYALGQLAETAAPFLTSVLLSTVTYGLVGLLDD